jgi:hypothetical protein
MKPWLGLFTLLLLVGCASTWVDPRLNLRNSRIIVNCVDDPLGFGPSIVHAFNAEGVESEPFDAKVSGDLVLKVEYRFVRSNSGISTVNWVRAQMVDPRYRSVEARYAWEGQGLSAAVAAQNLVEALTAR